MLNAKAPISKKQIKYIYFCARKLGLDNDLLHDMAYSCTSKKSISKLTMGEAANLIDVLAREAFPSEPRKQSNVIYLISADQISMLMNLASLMAWGEVQMNNLSQRMYKKPYRHLRTKEAQGLIEGMKSILSRKEVRHG